MMQKTCALVLFSMIICSVFIVFLPVSNYTASSGRTLYVGGIRAENYTKIQDAINAADNGDTVYVYSGKYYENIQIDKSIDLIGENKNSTIIDGYAESNVVRISADRVTVNGFTIQNSGKYYPNAGIKIISDFNIISGNIITSNNFYGIHLDYSFNNTIHQNNVRENSYGIYIQHSLNNNISENILNNNEWGIQLYESTKNTIYKSNVIRNGISLYNSTGNHIIKNNFINHSSTCIRLTQSSHNHINGNIIINNSYGMYIVHQSNNNIISENTITDNIQAISLHNSADNHISKNNIANHSSYSIYMSEQSHNNIISGNTIMNNKRGICIYSSSENNITKNIISNRNSYGINLLHLSNSNTITENILKHNHNAIVLSESSNNIISRNTISNNTDYGLRIGWTYICSNNTIYHNDFINNNKHAYDEYNNTWDDGYNSGGNYWDDYTGNDANGDGIGDIPYNISGGTNQDRYPKMLPFYLLAKAHGPYLGIINEIIQFNGSAYSGAPPYNWRWDFGDNSTSDEQNPVHTYNTIGEHTVLLTVTDNEGNSSSDTTMTTIRYMIVDAHGPYSQAINHPLQFTGSAQGGVTPYTWHWDFGDGTNSTHQNPTHTYTNGGNYTVTLIVTDNEEMNRSDTTYTIIHLPTTVWIDDDYNSSTSGWGYDHFASIQNGITGVDPGGTVYVSSGTYHEDITISKSIDLIGENKETTIIDGGTYSNVVNIYSNGVNISGFTIQGSRNYEYYYNSRYIDYNYPSSEIYLDRWYPYPYLGNYKGIHISSSNNVISGNIIKNNSYGIDLSYSSNNIIKNNSFISAGITLNGQYLDYWNTHIIENNYVNGKPIYYYKNKNNPDDLIISSDAGQIILANCSNFVIQDFELSSIDAGIQLGFSSYNTITRNTVVNSTKGILLSDSSNNIISENVLSDNSQGIYLLSSSDNEITQNIIANHTSYAIYLTDSSHNNLDGNTIRNNSYGFYLSESSHNNIISENTITDNYNYGIYLYSSSDNEITQNIIANHTSYAIYLISSSHNNINDNTLKNNYYGIYLISSYHNNIYHNNLINNTQHAYDDDTNIWDSGYPSGGNFWDDYSGIDTDYDGIGDMPYNISGSSNQDRYPLMEMDGDRKTPGFEPLLAICAIALILFWKRKIK